MDIEKLYNEFVNATDSKMEYDEFVDLLGTTMTFYEDCYSEEDLGAEFFSELYDQGYDAETLKLLDAYVDLEKFGSDMLNDYFVVELESGTLISEEEF